MKKFTKKLKGKKVLSLVLAAIMLATTFNMALPMLKLDAEAADVITIDGVTQERVVGTDGSYVSTYENYAAQYLNGSSNPTNIVIPGLNAAQDYVIQGMTYYPERDWMLVTAYHNVADGETTQSSKIFALDAATGDFVAMFSLINVDGTVNTDHGGGIAVSENNIYYACGDMDRRIAYAPLSALRDAPLYEHTEIQLVAEKDFVEVGSVSSGKKTAYTAYVCYDEGILWTGNFYDPGADLIGIDIAATDYNAPANNTYHSMVLGYKLQGSTPEEEWANLVGAKGTDCQGNPSYVIGLGNAIKDVQYAVVDNGKLYLSRSFGSGTGNSVRFGFGETSLLTVADIDLSQPGTQPVTISTTETDSLDKTVMAHNISEFKDYNMMPMSEGLCFIDDQLFITFEGASNKYLNESSGLTAIGNCAKPVDVIWQLDPYELMEVEKPAKEKSIYYERVQSLADIENGEEYIILFESVEKDPVTQNNILYAFNSKGNFGGLELSKGNASNPVGYDGMIGHKITEYYLDDEERLYLTSPEKDDIEAVRWTINKIGDSNYSIKNTDTYFANYNNFYANESKITMAPDNASYIRNMRIGQLQGGNGYFYISDGANYLWCNDGTNSEWMTKANNYYESTSGYSGITEKAGTFHCNATNSPILGGSVPEWKAEDYPGVQYPDRAFKIYRREVDSSSSTYESRVYSNLDTKLEADGTYTVTLDTYAISPNHYQYVGERPTDYIIVADTSYSMIEGNGTGIREFTESDVLRVNSLTNESDTSGDRGEGIIGYTFYNSSFDIRYLYNGKYYKLYVAINNTNVETTVGIVSKISQYYFLYFIGDDGKYYCFSEQSPTPNYICTQEEFKKWVANPEKANGYPYQTASSTKTANGDRQAEPLFTGKHSRFDNINSMYGGEHDNIDAVKTTAKKLVDQIATQNSGNRIALVTYGENSSYLHTTGDWKNDTFTNAFWDANSDNVSNLKTKIDSVSVSPQTNNEGLELEIAKEIINKSGISYKVDGERNVAVIFLSDGIPGDENPQYKKDGCGNTTDEFEGIAFDETDSKNAANKVIATAKTIKDSGAFIYTVLFGNNSVGSFSKKTYMDAVSSKYPAATSMDKANLGGQSVDGITYAMNIATASYDYFVNFGSTACKEVASNNAVGLDNLDASSYLREVLSEALKFPENEEDYDIIAQLVPGEYDEIGRFRFGKAVNTDAIKPEIDKETKKIITVTGYDYSTQYISRGNPGNALRVIIKGLLANEDVKVNLENAPVSVNGKTGIYKNETKMNADVAFRNFPTENINIPEYTYVLDYGLQMLDTDVNGTLKAVSAGLTKQDINNYNKVSENELVAIQEGDENLLYHTTPTNMNDSGYVLIQRDDGEYDWFEIKVVPASNVYFEEDDMNVKATDASNTAKADWTDAGEDTNKYRPLAEEGDVVGFDNAYDDANATYSNGNALTATVTASQRNSKTQTFDFVGTGFDLVSRCGSETGILLVNIKNSAGKSIAASLVDTYCEAGTFNQTPVFNWSGDHGTYTVEVSALYLSNAGALNAKSKSINKSSFIDTGLEMKASESFDTDVLQAMLDEAGAEDVSAKDVELVWFDDNSIFNGGTGVAPTKKGTRNTTAVTELVNYIDGFRVYNPLGTAPDAYTESNVSYANVIDNLAPVSSSDGSAINELFGIAFITGLRSDVTSVSFEEYKQSGPKGELYLNAGKAISFKIDRDENEKVMLGLRAVNGATTINVNGHAIDKGVNSATEMYYDISNCIENTGEDVIITVENTGSGLVAVNHIKFSGGSGSNGTVVTPRSMARSTDATEATTNKFLPITQEDLVAIETVMNAEPIPTVVKNGVVIPLAEEEAELPEDNTNTDNDNTNDGTDTEESENEEFSLFSLIEMLIAFIEKILYNAFGAGSIA